MDASEITQHIIDHIAVNYEDFNNDEIHQISVLFKESELQPHVDSSSYSLEEYGEIEFYLPQRVKSVSFHAVSEKVLEPIAEYVNDCCPTVESTAYARKVLLDLTGFDQSTKTDSVIRLYLTETLADNRFKDMVLSLYRSMRGYYEEWDISKAIVYFNQQTNDIELQLEGEAEKPYQLDVFSDSLSEYYSIHTTYESQDSVDVNPIDQYLLSGELSPTVVNTFSYLEEIVLEQLGQKYTEYSDVHTQEVGYTDGSVTRKYTVEQSM